MSMDLIQAKGILHRRGLKVHASGDGFNIVDHQHKVIHQDLSEAQVVALSGLYPVSAPPVNGNPVLGGMANGFDGD
ncbi:hypothetical protein [Aestuariivirga sp.]|uniref:hypothetical protein n=1 Tax=Aestuariivirga sp. TaxID=2650926 RepID=UPI003594078D